MTLTARFVKSARHAGGRKRADRHHDLHGLYLQVMPSGSKQWIQRLTVDGKRCHYGLGGYPYMTLGEARLLAFENVKSAREYRRARARGEQPPVPAFESGRRFTVARRNGQPAPAPVITTGLTFAEAFEKVLAERAPTWKESVRESSLRSWRANLRDYLHCVATLPVATLTSADLQSCLAPVWAEKPKTGVKVLRRAGTVLEWAVAANLRTDNPARAVARSRPRANNGTAHYTALPHAQVAGALARIEASDASAAVKGAFRLQVLTALRAGEARLARWEEIDLETATWTIPGERMKHSERGEHRVPLSPQAIEALQAAGPRKEGLVFRTRGGAAPSESAARKLLGRLGIKANPHGFRSSFRDWAAENGYDRELAESALAHTVGSAVEAAYRRSDLLERRRAMLTAWADYLNVTTDRSNSNEQQQ